MTNYLSIDPSGSGTTGILLYNSENNSFLFNNFVSKDWTDHFNFIKKICEENKINFLFTRFCIAINPSLYSYIFKFVFFIYPC